MIYLSGAVSAHLDEMLPSGVGWMIQPAMGNVQRPGRPFAADNGCFAQGERFDAVAWLQWLSGLAYREACLFAVSPDVVGDAAATLARSRPYFAPIRDLGYRVAFVAQDGLENFAVPWSEFDCLFVGGSTEWKLSEPAYRLMAEAKQRGKWTHVGRVNSERRLRACAVSGVDSVDGTYLAFGPDVNAPRLARWLAVKHLPLFEEALTR